MATLVRPRAPREGESLAMVQYQPLGIFDDVVCNLPSVPTEGIVELTPDCTLRVTVMPRPDAPFVVDTDHIREDL